MMTWCPLRMRHSVRQVLVAVRQVVVAGGRSRVAAWKEVVGVRQRVAVQLEGLHQLMAEEVSVGAGRGQYIHCDFYFNC